jgi:hypothetical protein
MNSLDMEKARREELRWLILRSLYAAQPIGTSEMIIRTVVDPIVRGVTELEIRNQLDYLLERKLIGIEKNHPVWFAKINRTGIDLVEYAVDCDPGIARPKAW